MPPQRKTHPQLAEREAQGGWRQIDGQVALQGPDDVNGLQTIAMLSRVQ